MVEENQSILDRSISFLDEIEDGEYTIDELERLESTLLAQARMVDYKKLNIRGKIAIKKIIKKMNNNSYYSNLADLENFRSIVRQLEQIANS